jgi:hypothetical protein
MSIQNLGQSSVTRCETN